MTKRAERVTGRKRLPSRQGAVVTSIALPEALHRRARIAAAERGVVLTAIFREAVAEWLDRHEGRRRP